MLPVLQKEVVERRNWLSNEEIADYYAVSQCLPGVIAVSTSAFIGQKIKGRWGGAAACLGVVLPSFVIITLIAVFIQNFMEHEVVQRAFFGINVVVCALIAQVVINLWKSSIKNVFALAVYLVALLLAIVVKVPIVTLIVAAIAAGIAADAIKRRRAGEGNK